MSIASAPGGGKRATATVRAGSVRSRRLGAEVPEHGQHSAVVVGAGRDGELAQDVVDVLFSTVRSATTWAGYDELTASQVQARALQGVNASTAPSGSALLRARYKSRAGAPPAAERELSNALPGGTPPATANSQPALSLRRLTSAGAATHEHCR